MAVGDRFEHELAHVKLLGKRRHLFQVALATICVLLVLYYRAPCLIGWKASHFTFVAWSSLWSQMNLFSQVFVWTPRKQLFIEITQKSDIIPSVG